ncbi:MAG: gamma carbonic anhydrase family protein [Bacteroidota bacterium]
MGAITFGGRRPRLDPTVFVAAGAQVIGDVEIGAGSSVWFGSVIRGDVHWIRIGERTNIQDLSVLHVTTGTAPLQVGSDVTVGHRAILHGCTVEDGSLIGMGAIVLDGARIGSGALVAAGAVVSAGYRVPPATLVAGVPATVKRSLRPDEVEGILRSAQHYRELAQVYQQSHQEP